MTPPKPPLVIFDVDGTLIEESSRLRAQAEAVAEHFGGTPERLQAVIYAFFAVHDHMVQSGSTLRNNIPEYLYQMGERLGCPLTHNEAEVLAEQWTKAYQASHNEPVLFPDAVPCLRALQEHGCRLIIASGNTVATRVALLERTGIRDYFSTIYAAQDVGFQKQDKQFWSYLLKAEGYTSDDTVMVVGNQPNDDILQPINLGLKAFLITRPTELKKFSQDYHVAPTDVFGNLDLFMRSDFLKSYFIKVSTHNVGNQKILFVMQHVTPGTHMDYVYEMARTLKEERGLSLELLIEKPTKTHLPDWVLVQSYANPVLRSLENLWFMIRARMRGVKVFYIHYSFLSAITAGVVARLTGGHVFYWNAGMPWQYKRSWREEWYQRLAYKCIHTLVTGAEALRQPYATMYGLNSASIRVIPNWIDRASIHKHDSVRNKTRARLGIPLEAPLLLFVHKLSKRKGAHFLPELLDVLKDETVHLVIAGDGPLADNLRTEFKSRDMDTRAHLLGVVPREEVKVLYQAADVFIMPSEEEGSPHSLIEAMAYDLPFVTFDVGGVAETATPELAHFVVSFGDIQAMARRVAEISADKYPDTHERFERVLPRYEKSVIVDAFLRLLTTSKTDDLV